VVSADDVADAGAGVVAAGGSAVLVASGVAEGGIEGDAADDVAGAGAGVVAAGGTAVVGAGRVPAFDALAADTGVVAGDAVRVAVAA
jgi:hypothetical protein